MSAIRYVVFVTSTGHALAYCASWVEAIVTMQRFDGTPTTLIGI